MSENSDRCSGACCEEFCLPYTMAELFELLEKVNTDPNQTRFEPVEFNAIVDMVIPVPRPARAKTDAGGWYTCKHLLPRNEAGNRDCGIYEKRPEMCRDYPYGRRCENPNCTSKKYGVEFDRKEHGVYVFTGTGTYRDGRKKPESRTQEP